MKFRKLFQRMFTIMLFTLLLNGTNVVYAQPKAGDWKVPARFGQFVFSVNSGGTQIIKLATTFSNYAFGGITQNGTVTSQPSPGWPISNGQFAITTSINPTGTIKLTINGIFTQLGDQASGTWSMLVSGQTDAGTWGPVIFTSVEEVASGVAERFLLEQNYPNPFNPSTNIPFSVPSKSFVSLRVFDALGREVSNLVAEDLPAGIYSRQWNAPALPSGVYFYRLVANAIPSGQAGSFTETKKLLLLR
jgi:hypothetical protein